MRKLRLLNENELKAVEAMRRGPYRTIVVGFDGVPDPPDQRIERVSVVYGEGEIQKEVFILPENRPGTLYVYKRHQRINVMPSDS